MGFERVFKGIPIELDGEFVSIYKDEDKCKSQITDIKNELIVYCMQDHTEDGVNNVIKHITWDLKMLVSCIEDLEKIWINQRNKSENGDIWFCGWEFEQRNDYKGEENREEAYDWIFTSKVRELALLSMVVKTPDYFDDCEKFFEKMRRIEECLDFDDVISDYITHRFICKYIDYDITYEEDDEKRAEIFGTENSVTE